MARRQVIGTHARKHSVGTSKHHHFADSKRHRIGDLVLDQGKEASVPEGMRVSNNALGAHKAQAANRARGGY